MTAEQLKEARHKLGLTQAQMANELKTKLRGYQRWEGGERHIPGPVEVAVGCLLERAKKS